MGTRKPVSIHTNTIIWTKEDHRGEFVILFTLYVDIQAQVIQLELSAIMKWDCCTIQ